MRLGTAAPEHESTSMKVIAISTAALWMPPSSSQLQRGIASKPSVPAVSRRSRVCPIGLTTGQLRCGGPLQKYDLGRQPRLLPHWRTPQTNFNVEDVRRRLLV